MCEWPEWEPCPACEPFAADAAWCDACGGSVRDVSAVAIVPSAACAGAEAFKAFAAAWEVCPGFLLLDTACSSEPMRARGGNCQPHADTCGGHLFEELESKHYLTNQNPKKSWNLIALSQAMLHLVGSLAALSAALRFGKVSSKDLPRVVALETASYPADEAATEEQLKMRLREAGQFFHGAYADDGQLCGYVCGTLTSSQDLDDESMRTHDPKGHTLCIHSVVVAEEMREQVTTLSIGGRFCQHVTPHVCTPCLPMYRSRERESRVE